MFDLRIFFLSKHHNISNSDLKMTFQCSTRSSTRCRLNQFHLAITSLLATNACVAAFQVKIPTTTTNNIGTLGSGRCYKYRNEWIASLDKPKVFAPMRPRSNLFYYDREFDSIEEFVGGMRYEMVELPDCLVDTTLYVGNLCEFVTDEILSEVFRSASTLNFLPACIARKPNSSSLKYGFVTFPTVAEKEAAIIKFTGYILNGRPLKVECIIDYEYRVRVPEKLVLYTVGESKKTRDGSKNTLRMAQNSRDSPRKEKKERERRGRSSDKDRDRGKKKKLQRRKNRKRINGNQSSGWSM